jgi:predicted RNA-binding protein Jag
MSRDEKDEGEKKPMTEPTQAPGADAPDKKAQTQAVLGDILRLMGYPAKLDLKDGADGGVSVAMHFEGGDVPFAAAGKRSFVVDSMQFLVNKVVNRPNTEKRWVSLGVGEHPAPRPQRATPAGAPVAASPGSGLASVPARSTPTNGAAPPNRHRAPVNSSPPLPAARPAPRVEEAAVEVKADPLMSALGQALAEKAAKHGRFLGVLLVDTDDRARLLKAGQAVKGQSTRVEGEGHNRRVVFTPDKPVPMPKKTAMPVFDDEDDGE